MRPTRTGPAPVSRPVLAAMLALVLAGCAGGDDVARYLVDPPAPDAQLPNRLGQAELRAVRLPEYAASQEIARVDEDGVLRTSPANIWADAPERAVTQALARQIGALSGATVIAEPWPLQDLPARRLEVRIERMIAQNDGRFRLSGQYFVVPVTAEGRDILRRFDLTVPMTSQAFPDVAEATARAIDALARRIAALE